MEYKKMHNQFCICKYTGSQEWYDLPAQEHQLPGLRGSACQPAAEACCPVVQRRLDREHQVQTSVQSLAD